MAAGLLHMLQASAGLLASASRSADLSRLQAAALGQAIETTKLSVSDKANVALAVNQMPWASAADLDSVLTALFESGLVGANRSTGVAKRRINQNWTTGNNYLPQTVWSTLESVDMVSSVKIDAIMICFSSAWDCAIRASTRPR